LNIWTKNRIRDQQNERSIRSLRHGRIAIERKKNF
jgi:hypothetical protein